MGIRRLLVWYIMLNKRLLKRWSFILVLLVAPLMVLVMNALSGGSKGVLRILLYQETESEAASQIISDLTEGGSVVHYEQAESINVAERMVAAGEADAVWLFDTVIEDTVSEAAAAHRIKPLVKVIQREDTISLMMARERLYSEVYPYLNYEIYVDYVNDDISSDIDMTDDELLKIYEKNKVQDKLFQRKYIDGQNADGNNDYLLAPIRGMLAVWLVLCGLVSCLYYMLDKDKGIFDRLSNRYGVLKEAGYHMVIIIIAAVVMLTGLVISGTATSLFNEIICMLALVYVTTGYCCLIRSLCRKPQIMGIVIPFLVVMMLGFSSAFISLKFFSHFRFLHPVYLYIMSVHSSAALLEMLLFGSVLYITNYIIRCSHFLDNINI